MQKMRLPRRIRPQAIAAAKADVARRDAARLERAGSDARLGQHRFEAMQMPLVPFGQPFRVGYKKVSMRRGEIGRLHVLEHDVDVERPARAIAAA
jgi:hypothetical protein